MLPDTLPDRHPNLSADMNDLIAESLINGGADLEKLKTGCVLNITTRNTTYRLERLHDGERDYPFLMSGHPRICPKPTRTAISGSTHGAGGMLRMRFVSRGMNMEFHIRNTGRTYTTTEVLEVTETTPETATDQMSPSAGDRP